MSLSRSRRKSRFYANCIAAISGLLISSPVLAQTPAAPVAAAPAAATAKPTPAAKAAAAAKPAKAPKPLPPLAANARRFSHGLFENYVVYSPVGTPKSFVLFLSGDGGWNLGVIDMAQQLVQQGAMVVGIDLPKMVAGMEADDANCVFPDGDLENLSHFVQAYYHLPTYLEPILVGYSSGATVAYASLVQAPKDTFGGALTLGFCPDLNQHKPFCKGSGIEFTKRADGHGVDFLPAKSLSDPWIVMQGETDQVCEPNATHAFVDKVPGAEIIMLPKVGHGYSVPSNWISQYKAAFAKLSSHTPANLLPPPPAALGDLPVIEVPAQAGTPPSDTFAILMTGDGGWAGLDQDVAAALTAKGIPVIGLDSLRYYWTPRTPDGLAADLDRMIRYYLAHLDKKRVLLVGYSQGADVMPFAINRLPAATRASISLAAIMGMSEHALFEFHMSSWVSDSDAGPATMPEVERISGTRVLCIYGDEEDDTLCPKLNPHVVDIVKLKGGHHFNGDYERLAREILNAAAAKS